MAEDLSSSDIRARKFRISRRGYDRAEVAEFLGQVADQIGGLTGELSSITSRLNQLGITDLPDLKAEIEDVGVEIQTLLDSAMSAAEGVRLRASQDAVDATADADRASRALRGDAWAAGTELLDHADSMSDRMIGEAGEDALFIRAEAEQEAKRLVSDSRRQAEEMLRSSREDGERSVVIAKAESDALLDEARRAAEKAQERARALENRRSELLTELEAAESAIRDIEATKADLAATPETGGIRVISSTSDERTHWPENQGAVRIVPAPTVTPEMPDVPVDADAMAAEVEELRGTVKMPEPAPRVEIDIREEPEPIATESADQATDITGEPEDLNELVEVAEELEVAPEPQPVAVIAATVPEESIEEPVEAPSEALPEIPPEDSPEASSEALPEEPAPAVEDKVTIVSSDRGIDALFAKLRQPPPLPEKAEPVVIVEETPPPRRLQVVPDLGVGEGFDRRNRMLLPIENSGLRGLKRRIVELQNRVLQELRTSSGEWRLGREFVAATMGDELDAVLQDSFRAGHAAAAESVGVGEPQLTGGPEQGAAEIFTADLHRDVHAVIERDSEGGSRRLAADVGRVFRSWRTDDAERHVRQAARRAFNDGLLAGYERLEVAAVEIVAPGRPCGQCGAGTGITWQPGSAVPASVEIPPTGPVCAAMIALAGSNGFDSRPEQ